MTLERAGRASVALVLLAVGSLGAVAAPQTKEDPLDTIMRLASAERMRSNESSAVGELRALLSQELVEGNAQLPRHEGYTFKAYRAARTPGGAFAFTATPIAPGKTGLHGFCADSTGRVCYSADGTEPRVAGHRCAAACPDLPADGPSTLLPRPRLSSDEKRALLAAINTDPRIKGIPGAQLEAFRILVGDADTSDDPARPATLAHAGAVSALTFLDSASLASVSPGDAEVKVWSVEGSPPRRLTSPGCTGLEAVVSSPSTRSLVAACSEGSIKAWPWTGPSVARDLTAVSAPMIGLDVTADGTTVLVAAKERIELWTLPAGRLRAKITAPGAPVRSVGALSPDGTQLALGFTDSSLVQGSVGLWDARTGTMVGTLEARADVTTLALRYTVDGQHVIGALSDASLVVWSVATRRRVARASEHAAVVNALAVTPDGAHALSASSDFTVKVWSLPGLRPVGTLRGHAADVFAVAVSPDGRTVVSGDRQGAITLWDLTTRSAKRSLQDPRVDARQKSRR
jgi:WD40 repeat protein